MAVVVACVTNGARQYWPQFFGGMLGISAGATTPGAWNPLIKTFKIGRGGWIDPGSGPVPRSPDPTLTDLDVILDYSRSGPDKRYTSLAGNIMFLEKSLSPGNFSFITTSTLNVQCLLDFGDFNDIQGVPSNPPGGSTLSPSGTPPQLYELGLFTDHPSGSGKLMVMYGTFTAEQKTSAKQILNQVQITF